MSLVVVVAMWLSGVVWLLRSRASVGSVVFIKIDRCGEAHKTASDVKEGSLRSLMTNSYEKDTML